MRIFRSVFVIAYANLSRWKRDYRVWLILAFMGFLIVNSLKGYVQYGMAENKKMTFCVLPMLFQATDKRFDERNAAGVKEIVTI